MRVFLKKQIEQYQRKIIRQIIDSNKSVIVTGKNSIGKTFIAKELFEILDDCVYVSGYPKEIRNLKNKKSIEILKSVDLSTFFCISDENYYVFSYLINYSKRCVLFTNQCNLCFPENVLIIDAFKYYLTVFNEIDSSDYPKLSTLFGSKYFINEFSCDDKIYIKKNKKIAIYGVN